MRTLLAEQPLIVAFMLGAIAAGLILGWMQTGRKWLALGGLFSAALVPLAFVLAAYWETDGERIRAAIERTAAAVRDNDIDRAVLVIEPGQRDRIAAARADLSRFRFDEARVSSIRGIQFISGSYPPEAEVDLTVSVVVSDRRGQFNSLRVPRRVVLQFRQDTVSNEWFVYDYNHMPVVGNPDGFSPQR